MHSWKIKKVYLSSSLRFMRFLKKENAWTVVSCFSSSLVSREESLDQAMRNPTELFVEETSKAYLNKTLDSISSFTTSGHQACIGACWIHLSLKSLALEHKHNLPSFKLLSFLKDPTNKIQVFYIIISHYNVKSNDNYFTIIIYSYNSTHHYSFFLEKAVSHRSDYAVLMKYT